MPFILLCNGLTFIIYQVLISVFFLTSILITTTWVLCMYNTLHWLPVRQRIVFKILLIVFKALNGQAPSYILELLTLKSNSHSHNLRSSNDTLLLKMPTCKTKVTLGDRAFSCAAPKIWNNLPLSIKKSQSVTSFKTKLKTHLFVQAFQ